MYDSKNVVKMTGSYKYKKSISEFSLFNVLIKIFL